MTSVSTLIKRLALLGTIFAAEVVGLSAWLDTGSLTQTTGLVGLIANRGPDAVLVLVVAAAVFLVLAYAGARDDLERLSRQLQQQSIDLRLLAAHAIVLAGWLELSARLFDEHMADASANLLAAVWLTVGALAGWLAMLAFVPRRFWLAILRCTRRAWMYAVLAAIASYLLKSSAEALWRPLSTLTFGLVAASIRPFVPDLVVDPTTFKIGSKTFSVIIAKECSGLEGAGLMFVFGALWLWFLRREYRFPRALLLIPVGVIVIWLVNIVRIDALFLIGYSGWKKVAAGGFHSQAGWIAFNVVALSLSVISRQARWLTTERAAMTDEGALENPVAPYLVPLLTILASGMIARALSSGFEWLYPLRVISAAAALWCFRARYRGVDWHPGWFPVVAGAATFILWVAFDRLAGPQPDNGIAAGLAALTPAGRAVWLAFRVVGAVVTVPIAEELAFRGYVLRRLVADDFAVVPYERASMLAVVGSSLLFGILHGDRFAAGAIAGMIYAGVAMKRGHLVDAIVAHAATNLLIAVTVLWAGSWQLW